MTWLLIAAFAATIPAANWMIGNVGTTCTPEGLCLIPVWPGVMAPSGVLAIGAALVLRDLVQRRAGFAWALVAVAIGTLLSFWAASPALASPRLQLSSSPNSLTLLSSRRFTGGVWRWPSWLQEWQGLL